MVNYVKGDATAPQGEGSKIICHVVNDIGRWGAGFSGAVSRRYVRPEAEFRKGALLLGDIQMVSVAVASPLSWTGGALNNRLWVCNMCAQHGVRYPREIRTKPAPLDYQALTVCLRKVAEAAMLTTSSVHMPRIGCGLAGGQWDLVEALIKRELTGLGVSVTVYDL